MRLWRDPVLVAPTLACAAVMPLLLWPGSSTGWLAAQALVGLPLMLALALGAAVLSHRLAGRCGPGHPARRFWRVWSLSCVLWAGASVVVLVSVINDPGSAARPPQQPLFLLLLGLGGALAIGVLLSYPLGARSRPAQVCLWLDVATVTVGAAGFGGYAVLSAPGERVGPGTVLTGPVVFLVCLFAISKLLISGSAPFTRRSGVLLAAAATLAGIAQAVESVLYAHGQGRWHIATITVAHLLVFVGTRVQQPYYRATSAMLSRRRRLYSPLPYIAIAATYTLLLVTLLQDGLRARSWAVLAAAIIGSALVVGRQLAAFADNARLVAELGTKVVELGEARSMLQATLDERDVLTNQLRHLAFHDDLTGLANRALFLDRAELATTRARRDGELVVVIVVDLDDFKPVNDVLGHAAGDAVLKEIAIRLRGCVREADTVARLGGDEFAILLERSDHSEPLNVVEVAQRVVLEVRAPIPVADASVRVGASVGVAHDRGGRLSAEQLLHAADTAMYTAKNRGKGTYEIAGDNEGRTGAPTSSRS